MSLLRQRLHLCLALGFGLEVAAFPVLKASTFIIRLYLLTQDRERGIQESQHSATVLVEPPLNFTKSRVSLGQVMM